MTIPRFSKYESVCMFSKPIKREPEFHCAVEVHARLGLTLKYLGLLNWSRIHLNWALENSSQNFRNIVYLIRLILLFIQGPGA